MEEYTEMKKALVLGGTRFFGVHLVEALLAQGLDVTVATRGNTINSFGDKVKRITFDRENLTNFKEAFADTTWDLVFDQICYTSQDAINAMEVFEGKTEKYILTSTLSVYSASSSLLHEEDFDPYHYPIVMGTTEDFTYQEGKRQAEAVFFQKAPFKTVAIRIPIVLGINDYTERLLFHVKKVAKEEEIFFTNVDASMGFIDEKEAGEFIAWISSSDFDGPINACANGVISIKELISLIEKTTGKKAKLATEKAEGNVSPYSIASFWAMSNEKAKKLGYSFTELQQWLPPLIDDLAVKEKN